MMLRYVQKQIIIIISGTRQELKESHNKKLEIFKGNNVTQLREVKMPCQCLEGECGCCTGIIMQNFNINIRQHLCINMTYEPEDLAIGVKMSFNDIVLLSNRVSGK